jgi:hypothetical protein
MLDVAMGDMLSEKDPVLGEAEAFGCVHVVE